MRGCSRAVSQTFPHGGPCDTKLIHIQVAELYFGGQISEYVVHHGRSCFCTAEDGCNSNDWSTVYRGHNIPTTDSNDDRTYTPAKSSPDDNSNPDANSKPDDKSNPEKETSTVVTVNSASRCPFDLWAVILSTWMYYTFSH